MGKFVARIVVVLITLFGWRAHAAQTWLSPQPAFIAMISNSYWIDCIALHQLGIIVDASEWESDIVRRHRMFFANPETCQTEEEKKFLRSGPGGHETSLCARETPADQDDDATSADQLLRKRMSLTHNEQKLKQCQSIEEQALSPDGISYAFVAKTEEGRVLVVNHREIKLSQKIFNLTFRPDGRQVGYFTIKIRGGNQELWWVVEKVDPLTHS